MSECVVEGGSGERAIQSLRLLKSQLAQLARGRRRISAALDRDLTIAAMVEMFFAEMLDSWVAQKVAEASERTRLAGANDRRTSRRRER